MKRNWIRRLHNPEIQAIIEQFTLVTGNDHDTGDLITVWHDWGGIHRLYTLLIIKARLYHLYFKAIGKSNHNEIGTITSKNGATIPYKLITDLRLGRNGYFPSHDQYPYQVPDELDGLEEAIKRELGDFVFSDEYDTCSECGRPLRTRPDSYGRQPTYIEEEGDYLHADCLNPEWFVDWMENNKGKAVPYAILKKLDGFTTIEEPDQDEQSYTRMIEFESGMHPGQDDDPNKVTAYLSDHGIDVWYEYDAGQFDITWRPLVRMADHDQAQKLLVGFDPYQGYSTAEEISRALKTGQSTEHIKVTKSTLPPGIDISTYNKD